MGRGLLTAPLARMGAFGRHPGGFAGAFEGRLFGLRALVTSGGAVATLAFTVRVPGRGHGAARGLGGRCGLADFGQPVVQLPFVCCRRFGLQTRKKKIGLIDQ